MPTEHLYVERQEHYGTDVAVNVPMDTLRRHQCLCLGCRRLSPVGRCVAASELFEMCITHDIALMVTRCPDWEARDGD